jgi:hypothetical protein
MVSTTDYIEAISRKFASSTLSELDFAIKDIQSTLTIWRDEPAAAEYCRKLWHEFDVATARKQTLLKGGR